MFFCNEDFYFNKEWKVSITPYKNSGILFIENVYEHPYKVYEYLKSIPIKSHKESTPKSHNGKSFYDGQHYANNSWDDGRAILFQEIVKLYQVKAPDIFPPQSMYNQFRLLEDHPGHEYFFCPHTDNHVNFCLYLNPDVGDSAGTVLYSQVDKDFKFYRGLEHEEPWQTEERFKPELCIMSKFNCAVCFPGHLLHAQNIMDNRFKHKTRFTEVAFF
tara:strand:- start:321 stop:968 length:648 start_codon:yes stop_codon:yes gene_type:complete